MQKLQWYALSQLPHYETLPLVKTLGTVQSTDRTQKYFSFVICDGEHSAEATIYEDHREYACLDLPKKGDLVVVVGNTYRREVKNGYIIKLLVRLYAVMDPAQEAKKRARMLETQAQRENEITTGGMTTKTKRSLLKELRATIQPVEIRALILGCVYLTLENNIDLTSYTFTIPTIQNHRLAKAYIDGKNLKEESIKHMGMFIEKQLEYLVESEIIEQKQVEGETMFKVHKKLFTQMEMKAYGAIYDRRKAGTVLSELVTMLNRELGFSQENNYVINDVLLQRVLKKFIEQSKVYKTSDKLLFPNIPNV